MPSKLAGCCILALSLPLFALVFAVPALNAQSTTDGAIGGTVTDQSGAIVPRAVVTSTNLGTANVSSGASDASGRYLLIHLQPGVYALEITLSGFGTFRASNITV